MLNYSKTRKTISGKSRFDGGLISAAVSVSCRYVSETSYQNPKVCSPKEVSMIENAIRMQYHDFYKGKTQTNLPAKRVFLSSFRRL